MVQAVVRADFSGRGWITGSVENAVFYGLQLVSAEKISRKAKQADKEKNAKNEKKQSI